MQSATTVLQYVLPSYHEVEMSRLIHKLYFLKLEERRLSGRHLSESGALPHGHQEDKNTQFNVLLNILIIMCFLCFFQFALFPCWCGCVRYCSGWNRFGSYAFKKWIHWSCCHECLRDVFIQDDGPFGGYSLCCCWTALYWPIWPYVFWVFFVQVRVYLQLFPLFLLAVPPPTNVAVSCQNLKVTVSWEYSQQQPETSFRVHIKGATG